MVVNNTINDMGNAVFTSNKHCNNREYFLCIGICWDIPKANTCQTCAGEV